MWDVRRLWIIAVIAKAFHILPSVVARDLDNDPEQLSLACLPLLNYANRKDIFDQAVRRGNDDKTLDAYVDDEIMSRVKRNTMDLHKERYEHRQAHPKGGVDGCRLCVSRG